MPKPTSKNADTVKSGGMGIAKVPLPPEIKQKLIDDANKAGVPLGDYCKPALIALANGDIVYKVEDLRKK